MTPQNERMFANFFYGIIPALELTSTDTAVKVVDEKINSETEVSEERIYEIDIEEWIKLIGFERVKNMNLPYYIEILLKYHLILQSPHGYYEINRDKNGKWENGHDLSLLYVKTTPDFQEKLQACYNNYMSESNRSGNTDIETLLRNSSKLYNRFRYDFFSTIDSDNKIVPQENNNYNIPELLCLIKSLYDLSNLQNLRGITIDNIREYDYKRLIIPLH